MKPSDIANFVLAENDVPESALKMAAVLLMDTLAVAAGSATLEAGIIARDHAVRFLGSDKAENSCKLLFDGRRASLPGAAFAAATQIDNLDAHDGYNPTKGHIGCAVVPALCVFAEHCPRLTGRQALTALVVAYEFAARAGIALHATVHDYHTSGAWNALGVAALGSRARGLDGRQLRHALGIAEYHGPRSQMMREIANPSMLHDGSGMGALTGSMAVLLAENGFEGAPAITVESQEVLPIWNDLGTRWTIEENYIKPYPVCRWAHAAIDALAILVSKNEIEADQIFRVTVNTFKEAASLFGGMPNTTSQAQYSLSFALASFLVNKKISPQQVQGAGLADERVARLIERISIFEDSRHSERFPEKRWSDVTVELTDSTVLKSGDVHARGGPESPMNMGEIEGKFFDFTENLSKERQTQLWELRQALPSENTLFARLLELVHKPLDQKNV